MSSVIICAYTMERWEAMCRSVESVRCQPGAEEVVLVIDHNDGLLARSRAEWPDLVVVANRFSPGLSGARNTGVSESSSEVIAFLDDDATAQHGWLEALEAPFEDRAVGGVGGKVLPAWIGKAPAWLPPEFWWVVGCSYLGQEEDVAEIRNPIGANMAISRSVFDLCGGFREEVGRTSAAGAGCEETELSIRARAAGFTIWYRPDAVVHHLVGGSRTTVRYFLRRCYMEGVSKATVSAFAGTDAALSSERDYVRSTLPAGVARSMSSAVRGPDRRAGVAMAAAICAGVVVTGAGFVRGMLAGRLRPPPVTDPPRLSMPGRAA